MPQKITANLVRVKRWGKISLDLVVILNLGKPYGLKDQIYQGVLFVLRVTRSILEGRSIDYISDNITR